MVHFSVQWISSEVLWFNCSVHLLGGSLLSSLFQLFSSVVQGFSSVHGLMVNSVAPWFISAFLWLSIVVQFSGSLDRINVF